MVPSSAEELGPFITAAHAVLLQGLIQALEPIFLRRLRKTPGPETRDFLGDKHRPSAWKRFPCVYTVLHIYKLVFLYIYIYTQL